MRSAPASVCSGVRSLRTFSTRCRSGPCSLRPRLELMIGVLVVVLVALLIAGFFVSWNGGWPPKVFGGGGVLKVLKLSYYLCNMVYSLPEFVQELTVFITDKRSVRLPWIRQLLSASCCFTEAFRLVPALTLAILHQRRST